MNRLPIETQATVIGSLVEGASIRSVERMTGVHRDTITRLMVRVGEACDRLQHETMRELPCTRLEVDEIWCYVGKKQRRVTNADDPERVGDFWTFVGIDAETKLIPTWLVGKRDGATAEAFMADLASRLANRVQLSTDGLRAYVEAVEVGFGSGVDYAQIVKSYEAEPVGEGRYSPPRVVATDKTRIVGQPNEALISTAYVERQNLTMRMQMRRFTRLTNGFSKKRENLEAAVALHFAWYNFVRPHRSLKKATPAMAAGVMPWPWTVRDLVAVAN
jgi:IS1 family transposase